MKKRLRLVVTGAAGRMGRRVCALAAEDRRFSAAARVDRAEGCLPPRALAQALAQADVLVDFSAPEFCVEAAELCARARVAAVLGTTGLSPAQTARLRAAARRVAVFLAPNFSPGIHALCLLAEAAGRLLPGYDVSISETHHKLKRDAPSGTALRLASVVAEASGQPPAVVSQRIGDVVGEHTLTLAGPCERLELTHRAHSRDVFAAGALRAALWVFGRKPGFYDMSDMFRSR
ncbi:MAG: dihydrodipicolinate reductase C-terminal domain-containing protein [Elusimicrobia bacterium]|nr:dihydrodipicolinate reductase C-terminal domain-containing protein [Elusimicrobiota bacterium]